MWSYALFFIISQTSLLLALCCSFIPAWMVYVLSPSIDLNKWESFLFICGFYSTIIFPLAFLINFRRLNFYHFFFLFVLKSLRKQYESCTTGIWVKYLLTVLFPSTDLSFINCTVHVNNFFKASIGGQHGCFSCWWML